MFVGILLDAVVVRSLLVPTLLVLVGRRSSWPSRLLDDTAPDPEKVLKVPVDGLPPGDGSALQPAESG